MEDSILSGITGHAVADALGVPVEFTDRKKLLKDPVTSMRSYGTYNLPAGTWSDDTSLTLALVDSLAYGLNYEDMMKRFNKWLFEAKYTPFDKIFDVGITTEQALGRFKEGTSPLECGGNLERDNGNGSLMRILPIYYYLQFTYGENFIEKKKSFEIIHNVSALTHAHKRSQIACGIYIAIASEIGKHKNISETVGRGIDQAMIFYKNKNEYTKELSYYYRLENLSDLPSEEIKSSGYVVDTLEAAIWCLLTTETYSACVLKAVNLGKDTDTVAAVAGGLAGLYYGYESIPNEWLGQLAKREYIEGLCAELSLVLKN